MSEDKKLRFRDRFAVSFLRIFGVGLQLKKREAPSPPTAEYIFNPRAQVRKPASNYAQIYDEMVKNWIFGQIARAIIQQVIVPEIKITAKFAMKCTNKDCGMEHETEVEECSMCGGKEFREPDLEERKKAQALMDKPNPDYSFIELNRSALRWHLMLDDTYFSIAYKKGVKAGKAKRIPEEVYIEDSRFVFPVADAFNNYGNDEYFCHSCYDPLIDNIVRAEPNKPEPTKCPEPNCNGPLFQTHYVMQFGNNIKHRFGEKEIQHGSTDRMLPSLFGNPKAVSVWKLARTINHMDDYGEEVWGLGSTGGFVAFPDMTQEDVTEMQHKINAERAQNTTRDIVSGELKESGKINLYFLGVKEKPPEFIETMPDAKKMQSLDWYKLYRDSICAVYGVTPIFVSIIESGKSGNNPRMQIDVQKGTTEEHQQFLSDMWNKKVFPIFDINDWEIQFGSIEQVDDLRQAQVWEHRGSAAEKFINLGFDVTLDEHDNLEVSRVREEPEPDEEEDFEQEKPEEESEPMTDEIDEETGNFPTKNVEPPSAKNIRLQLETDLIKVIDDARSVGDQKKSYADAKSVMEVAHKDLIESARRSLAVSLKTDKLPKLDPEFLKKLNVIKSQRLKDFRKLLREELKREDE